MSLDVTASEVTITSVVLQFSHGSGIEGADLGDWKDRSCLRFL